MKPNIHHQIQSMLLMDAPINISEPGFVEQHLAVCIDCRSYAELVKRLETSQWSPYRKSSLSTIEKAQIAHNIQFRFRRKTIHTSDSLSILGLASIIVFLVITLGWALNTLRPISPLPATETSPVPYTQPEISIGTPLPQDTTDPTDLDTTQTPDIGSITGFAFEPGYQNKTANMLVDMNCDGQAENLLTVYRLSTKSLEGDNELRDYLGVAVQIRDENGDYQSAWTYTFDHSSRYGLYHIELISVDGCEQLLGINGQRWQGNIGVHSLQIFRWDGNKMVEIFEVPEGLMFTSEEEDPTAEVMSITTFTYGFPDPTRHTCDWTYHKYIWNGVTFIMVEEWHEQNQICGGAGG
jgi:hypothetical protein